MQDKKIAIIYDWIDKWGGVERILLVLHEMFPKADFYTSYFDNKKASWAKDLNIKTSFLQKFPQFIKGNRVASLFFYPYAFESFDFRGYDVVISVTSSFAKGVVTRPETKHICYLLTPTRYLWTQPKVYVDTLPRVLKPLTLLTHSLKQWDFVAAQRPDQIVSISKTVAERTKIYYKRDSEVIYPPFDLEYWSRFVSQSQNDPGYFLVVSRLEPYKKVDLAVKAFSMLKNKRLIIVGQGSQQEYLRRLAGTNISFLSHMSDAQLAKLYGGATALIMPQEEDFGYVSLEAQFFGCPVVAYKKGAATETVIHQKTGLFFGQQSVEAIEKAITDFDMIQYQMRKRTKEWGRKNVEKFTKDRFIKNFFALI